MTDYARIKRNIAKMIDQGAPEAEIDQYVASEKVTPAQLRAAPKPYVNPKGPLPERLLTGEPYQQNGIVMRRPILRTPEAMTRVSGRPAAPRPRAPTVAEIAHRPVPKPKPKVDPGVAAILGPAAAAPVTTQEALWQAEDATRAATELDVLAASQAEGVAHRKAWQEAEIPADGLAARMYQFGRKSAFRVGSGGARVLAAGMNAISEGFGDPVTNRANDVDLYVGRRIEGQTDLSDLKTDFSLGGLGSFVAEQGAGSAADMALLATGAGVAPYMVSQSGNIGQQRAENNDTGTATPSDILKAAPAAALSTAAERLGTKYLLPGADDAGNLLVRLGGSAVSEGATEGVQSFAEYAGGTVGTDRGFDLAEGLTQAGEGAITGGIVGPGLRVAMAEAPNAVLSTVRRTLDERAERAEREAFSPLAKAIAVDAFRPTQAAPAPVAAPEAVAPKKVAPAPRPEPVAPPAPKAEPIVTAEEPEAIASETGNLANLPDNSIGALTSAIYDGLPVDGGVKVSFLPEEIETLKGAGIVVSNGIISDDDVARLDDERAKRRQSKAAPKPVAPVAPPAAVEQPPIEQPAPAEVTKSVTPAPVVEQPEPAKAPVAAKAPIAAREETRRVTIPTGGKIDVRMELVSADDITQAEGVKQNRDLDRAASEAQIMAIVGKFDPEQLGDDNYTDRGAPIIGPDGTIESGNGRVLAINRVFDERPELAQQYRDYIESQGFDTTGVDRPVLIRRRVTEMDDATLRQFITGSNSDTKQELSAPERAAQDASDILTPDTMAKYMGGALVSQRNGEFIRKFIEAVPDGQRSTFMDEKGNLSTAGVARIENAMLARAFGNGTPAAKRFLSKAMENTDNQTRTLTGALSEVAADWGKMTAAMDEGTVDKRYDLTDKVLEAIGMVADAKGDGQSVANILKSEDMYDKLDPVVRKIIEAFHSPNGTRLKSKQKIAAMLENYARLAMEQRPTPDMFGEVVLRDPVDVLNEAFGDVDEGADMFSVAAEDKAPAKKQAVLADAGSGKPPRGRPAVFDVEMDDEPAGPTPPYAARMPEEDAGPYDPSIERVSFTDRASIYTGAARALGVDPDKFRLLPPERQIFLLSRLIKERFGVPVIVDRQLQDRFAIDQMLDMIQNVQGMAHILGLGGPAISLGGKLKLSLAKKARYLGAYYPGQQRIDLPQRSNSFAHEWAHALDYYLLDEFPGAGGSGLTGALRQDGRAIAEAGMGPQGVRAAYVDLLNAMFFDRAAMAQKIMDLEKRIAATKSDKQKAALQAQIDNYRAGSAQTQDNRSVYYRKAKALGGDYWQKPTEMFARAFEAYVSFRVEALGMTTEMIGKGDAAYLSDADDRLAKTFPKGVERNEIFRAFDELFVRLNEQTALGRAPVMPAPDTGDTDPVTNLDKLAKMAPKSLFAREAEAWKADATQRRKAKAGRANHPKGFLKRKEDQLSTVYMMAGRVRMIARHWKSSSVMSLHDMLTHREGKGDFVGRNFIEAVSMRRSRNLNRLSNIMRKHGLPPVMSEAEDKMLRDLLITQDPEGAPDNFVAAASAIRQLLDQEFYENQNVGLDIGYVKNGYLPRIVDMPKIDAASDAFLEKAGEVYGIVFDNEFGTDPAFMLTDEESLKAFVKTVRALAKERPIASAKPFFKAYNELAALYRAMEKAEEPDSFAEAIGKKVEEVTDLLGELMDETRPIFAEVKAERWLSAMRTADMDDFDAHAPNGDYTKKRELPPEADKLLEDFYINNPLEAITTYLSQSAKRTEYARTFGPKGEKRTALFEKIAAEGVSLEDQQALQRIVDIAAGRQPTSIPKPVQGMLSFVHAAGTMVLLPRAVLSSLSESVTAGMRTNDVRNSFRALAQQISGALGSDNGRHRAELARAIGIVDDGLAGELAEARFGGTFGDVTRWDRYVAIMFQRTGLIALTRSQRTHLLGTAQAYFDNLAGRVLDGKDKDAAQATALLKELGVRDVEAFAKQIRELGRLPTVEEVDTPYGYDFGTASRRLIDQIIQNPTVMDRPELANNPVGRVMFGIMSFSFAFWRNVIKRQGILMNETRKRNGVMDAAARSAIGFLPSAVALYIAQTLVSTIREFLLNHDRWEEEEEKGTLAETMLKLGATRTFSLGGLDPLIQAYTGLKYQRDLSNIMVGAAPGYFLQAMQSVLRMTNENSARTNTAEFNATRGVYQLVVAPAIAFGLARLPGGPLLGSLTGGGIMAATSPQAGKATAGAIVGEKGSVTDPETGEVIGPPKKKGEAAAPKYAF